MPSSKTRNNGSNNNRNNQTVSENMTDLDRTTLNAGIIDRWRGGQAEQAAWLFGKLKAAEDDYGFCQLNRTGAAPITSKALVAVFSPAHAKEREAQENVGTFRAPNMRMREDLSAYHLDGAARTAHGGYPTPTPTPTSKTPSMLERALGEAAENYKIAPETIEKEDLRYLNFFLDDIEGTRLRESWKRKSRQSGRIFVTTMLSEMNENDISLTAEETVQARMKAILDGGLVEATFASYLEE